MTGRVLPPARHSIRRQRLRVEAASEAVAMKLQPRLAEINQRVLVPVIARVLDEMDLPGRWVRIDRLELELGTVPLAELEAELPHRLERALRRAVGDALRGAGSAAPRVRDAETALQELLGHTLLRGTLPFWAPAESSLEEMVETLAAEHPLRLAATVRRLGRRPRVLERLAAQLPEATLAALVEVLEPEHAALVLAYVADLRRVHRAEPVIPLGDRRFGRLVWLLASAYLVRDPGTQFNRKSFVRHVLRGLADHQGISLASLLLTLHRALERTRRRLGLSGSLPAVVDELLRDLRRRDARRKPRPWAHRPGWSAVERGDTADALAYLLRYGVLPWEARLRDPDATEDGLLERLPALPPALRAVAGGDAEAEPATLAALVRAAAEARSAELATWPGHLLRSVLTRQLRAGGRAGEPTPARLLAALLESDPEGLAVYLRAVGGEPSLAEALAGSVPGPLADRLLERLDPIGADTARALHAALAALPSPVRPASEGGLREAILTEAMALREGEAPGAAFFARVLERLFGARIPEGVVERLRAAAEGWARPGGLPAAHAAAFLAAVEARAPGAERPSPAAEDAAPEVPARETDRRTREAVLAFLRGDDPPAGVPALAPDALRFALARLLDDAPEEVAPLLRRHATDARVRARWTRLLPEGVLVRLARVLGPRHHAALMEVAAMLEEAWGAAAPPGHPGIRERSAFWDFLLDFVGRSAGADRLVERFAHAFFADRAARCRALAPVPELPPVGERLLEGAERRARARGHAALRSALRRGRPALLAAWDATAAARPAGERARDGEGEAAASAAGTRRRPSRRSATGGEAEGEEGETLYLANAGLALLSPFLPHLFRTLGLLVAGEDGRERFREGEPVSRAVHLLQYLVDGTTDTPETALVLNKILCGLPLDAPVDDAIDATGEERRLSDGLLAAALRHWSVLSGTSVAGLRETFLQREGRIVPAEGGWRLTVQRKTVDVLVDQLPWSVSVIVHPWMSGPLYVNW